jgi:hypothetical protein
MTAAMPMAAVMMPITVIAVTDRSNTAGYAPFADLAAYLPTG